VDKRKKNNPFAWPFGGRRIAWIEEADRLISDAAESLDDAPVRRGALARAMRLYVKSAMLYRKAGLGAMAAGSWEDAAECAAAIGDEESAAGYEAMAAQIEIYYEEEL
jgi:hypothetical protein